MTDFISYVDIGNQCTGWGIKNPQPNIVKTCLESNDLAQKTLLIAILSQMQEQTALLATIAEYLRSLPGRTAKAERAAEMAMEKERQKTANAEAKAAEAKAAEAAENPTISLVHMTPEEIERAISNDRTLLKF